MSFINEYLFGLIGRDNIWILETFVVVLVTLIITLLVRKICNIALRKAQKTNNLWDDALVEAAIKPARWMVMLVGLTLATQIAGQHSDSEIFEWVPQIRRIGTIIIFTWFIVDFIRRMEGTLTSSEHNRKPMDPTTAMAVGKLLRISAIITAFLVIIQSLGYSIAGVLAFGGIGGIAVGFAAKDLLANFFGGLMIYLDRPFAVGDWIRSPDQNIEGTVEDVGWRLTCIRTFDKRPLYVPNGVFTQISVENPSRMTNRRIYETIGIRYDDAGRMADIVKDVKQMVEQHPDLDMTQTVIVNFNAFASSSLDFFVYCFTKTTNWVEYHQVKQDVLLKIIDIIASHEAECAFPTSTIHIPDGISINQFNQLEKV